MKEKKKKISVVKNNLYFLGLLWKIDPMGVVLCFFGKLHSVRFLGFLFGYFYAVLVRH